MQIIPTILSNNPQEVLDMLKKAEDAQLERVQIDIIDGVFASNKTLDPSFYEEIDTPLKLDFHLMVKEPIKWIEKCIRGGADRIIGQIEMMESQVEFVERLGGFGVKVGLALDLATPVSALDKVVLNDLDLVLVMSVPAGFGGQEFDFKVLEKIRELNRLRAKDQTPFKICDDGGITFENIDDMSELDVEEVAIGKRLYAGDMAENIKVFLKAART